MLDFDKGIEIIQVSVNVSKLNWQIWSNFICVSEIVVILDTPQ